MHPFRSGFEQLSFTCKIFLSSLRVTKFLHMHAHTSTITILMSTCCREIMGAPPLEFTHDPASIDSRKNGYNKFGRPEQLCFSFFHLALCLESTSLCSMAITN